MNTIELYLTDCAPNGTNDLIVVDGNDWKVLAVVDEATFGYVPKRMPDGSIMGDGRYITLDHDDSCGDVFVYKVTLKEVLRRLAVSPVDPDGAKLVERLRDAGIPVNTGGLV